MNLTQMRAGLVAAELDVAHFNALRTSAGESPAGIARGSTEFFETLVDPARPASPYYNRAVARSAGPLPAAALLGLPSVIAGIELTPAQLTPDSADQLLALGFRPDHQLCYLGQIPVGRRPVEHAVVRLAPAQTDLFFDLLELSGVAFPPDKRERKRNFYCTDTFQAFVAKAADGTVCGWTTMHVAGTVAFFGNSFTLPQFRGAGVHTALLVARLDAAAALGLEAAYTDVEHGSQSHHNCERTGFRTLTINMIWTRRR